MSGSLNGDGGHAGAASPRPAAPGASLVELDGIADGGFAEVEASIDDEVESLVLFREGGTVRAWLNVCPHAGRRLDWAPGQFLRSKDGLLVCAAHGAGFELQRGECVSGPCRGQSLRAVEVEVRGDGVFLRPGSAR